MAGNLQPLDQKFLISNPDGTPTDYFTRWAQQRQEDIVAATTADQVNQLIADWAAARNIIAGVALDGGGPLSADVTIDHAESLVTPGTYGDATHVPQFVVDQEGHIQGVVLVPISSASAFPGYIAGRWYSCLDRQVAAGVALTANNIWLLPFLINKPITVQALGARVTTLSALGNFQLAFYANNAATGRPTGNAVVKTGNMSTAATGAINAAVVANATLQPGSYWMGINQDNSTAVYQTVNSAEVLGGFLIGSATLANITNGATTVALSLGVAQAFGTWPDLTSAAFTETVTSGRSALLFMKAA